MCEAMAFRKQLIDLLSYEFRSASSLARELGMTRGDVEDDLRHALRSARAAGHDIEIVPARCKSCGFVFGEDRSEEHTSELQSRFDLVCRLLLEKKKKSQNR